MSGFGQKRLADDRGQRKITRLVRADRKTSTNNRSAEKHLEAFTIHVDWQRLHKITLFSTPVSREQESEITVCTGASKLHASSRSVLVLNVWWTSFWTSGPTVKVTSLHLVALLLRSYVLFLSCSALLSNYAFSSSALRLFCSLFCLLACVLIKRACLSMKTMCAVWFILIRGSVLAAWLNTAAVIMRL